MNNLMIPQPSVGASGPTTATTETSVGKMQQKLRSALQRFPRLKRCTIFKDAQDDLFTLTLSWPDGEADKTKTAIQRFSASRPLGCAQLLPANVVVQSPSPTNRRVANLIVEDPESEKKKFRIEIWDILKGQIASVQVDDVHGAFLSGEGVSWHDSEDLIAYVADKKAPSTFPNSAPHEAFQYREDWGEQYEGVVQPSVILFDIVHGKAQTAVSSTKSQFHPVFAPTNTAHPPGVFALAYTIVDDDPFKLGLIYCVQRSSEVRIAVFQRSTGVAGHELSLKHDNPVSQPMRPGGPIAKCPRFSPDSSRLIFLSSPPVTTHQTAMQLSSVDVDLSTFTCSSPPTIVVDVNPEQVDDTIHARFPSLYLENLPQQCFHGKDIICLTTQHLSRRRILRVNITNRSLRWIGEHPNTRKGGVAEQEISTSNKKPKMSSSTTTTTDVPRSSKDILSRGVLAVSPNNTGRVLISQSSPANPGVVGWVPLFPENEPESSLQLVFDIGLQVNHDMMAEILTHNCQKHTSEETNNSNKDESKKDLTMFESILVYPTHAMSLMNESTGAHKEKLPLIVFPHGGPHSAFSTDYSPEMAFIVEELRTGILFVNYRGSIGSPNVETLQTLPGKCGEQDVKDVMLALKETMSKYGQVFDEKRLGVMGGSHGGFLTAHLSGQYPDTFRCAVLRNPVTDIAAMSTVTDIPDWCYVEAMGMDAFDFNKFSNFPPTPEYYKAMFAQSPMRYVDKVKLPTLIAIGDKDRRVPPSQGLAYYRALKIRGVDVSLLRFPKDSHPIDRAGSNEVQWSVSIEFMKNHLSQ